MTTERVGALGLIVALAGLALLAVAAVVWVLALLLPYWWEMDWLELVAVVAVGAVAVGLLLMFGALAPYAWTSVTT